MFNSKNKADNFSGTLNTIGLGTTITGNIVSNGDLRIDGNIDGDLNSQARIVIGEKSVINGDIRAANAIIEGKVNGNVEVTEVLFLKATALIEGDMMMQKLVVENGAVFNGKSTMRNSGAKTSAKNEPKAEQ